MNSALTLLLLALALTLATAMPFADLDESAEPEPDLSPSSEADDAVCVSEAYLLSLGHVRRDLVHRVAPRAPALCPVAHALPCGTPHHMLRAPDGRAISYRQFCVENECERKTVPVNSVFSHLWEERSHDGVVMTMLDARYHEMPQKALHWAMHKARRFI